MKALRDNGIILRRIDYGEADRIITFLASEHGKIRVMAKGVRKQKSKLAGGIELFSISELHYIKGKGDIDRLMSTRLTKHYGNIVKDLERTEQAYAILKLIDKTIEDQTGQEYFQVLHESLAALDDNRIPVVLAELSFKARILQLLGNFPDFSRDNQGNSLDPDELYEFDFESVSFVPKKGGSYNKNHLKVLKLLAHNSPQSMAAVQGIEKYCQELTPLVRGMQAASLYI